MSNVRQLIEHLGGVDLQPFAQAAERYGDDLEQTWAQSEDGAGLLWLAAAVGVDPKQIVAVACDLLERVVEQVEEVSQETVLILEAVRAWERGVQSADDVVRFGIDPYDLIENPAESGLVAPWADDVINAAVWLTHFVGVGEIFPEGAWELADRLAHALALHGGWGIDDDPPNGYQHAYAEAMRRFALTIRGQITGAQVQAAAQQSGVWPL